MSRPKISIANMDFNGYDQGIVCEPVQIQEWPADSPIVTPNMITKSTDTVYRVLHVGPNVKGAIHSGDILIAKHGLAMRSGRHVLIEEKDVLGIFRQKDAQPAAAPFAPEAAS
jgi:hypothetical protein